MIYCLTGAGLVTEKIFIPRKVDLACFSANVLGLASWCDRESVIEKILKHPGLDEVSQARNHSPPTSLLVAEAAILNLRDLGYSFV